MKVQAQHFVQDGKATLVFDAYDSYEVKDQLKAAGFTFSKVGGGMWTKRISGTSPADLEPQLRDVMKLLFTELGGTWDLRGTSQSLQGNLNKYL